MQEKSRNLSRKLPSVIQIRLSAKKQMEEELKKLYTIWDDMMKQKSRLNWELRGDSNINFFHGLVKYKQKKNHIHCILHN